MGKTEEHQAPLTFESLPEEGLSMVIKELYFAEVSGSIQQIKAICLHFRNSHYARLLDSVHKPRYHHDNKNEESRYGPPDTA
jgi:hypothetical protein